jgi:hypothetical protein
MKKFQSIVSGGRKRKVDAQWDEQEEDEEVRIGLSNFPGNSIFREIGKENAISPEISGSREIGHTQSEKTKNLKMPNFVKWTMVSVQSGR